MPSGSGAFLLDGVLGGMCGFIIVVSAIFTGVSGSMMTNYSNAKGISQFPCGDSQLVIGNPDKMVTPICSADCTALYNNDVTIFALTLATIILNILVWIRMYNPQSKGRLFAFTYVVGGISFLVVFALGINNYSNLDPLCKHGFESMWQFVQACTWISLVPLIIIFFTAATAFMNMF